MSAPGAEASPFDVHETLKLSPNRPQISLRRHVRLCGQDRVALAGARAASNDGALARLDRWRSLGRLALVREEVEALGDSLRCIVALHGVPAAVGSVRALQLTR